MTKKINLQQEFLKSLKSPLREDLKIFADIANNHIKELLGEDKKIDRIIINLNISEYLVQHNIKKALTDFKEDAKITKYLEDIKTEMDNLLEVIDELITLKISAIDAVESLYLKYQNPKNDEDEKKKDIILKFSKLLEES